MNQLPAHLTLFNYRELSSKSFLQTVHAFLLHHQSVSDRLKIFVQSPKCNHFTKCAQTLRAGMEGSIKQAGYQKYLPDFYVYQRKLFFKY